MQERTAYRLVSRLALCLGLAALGADAATVSNETVDRLIQLSGLDQQVEQIPAQILSDFDTQLADVPKDTRAAARGVVLRAYAPSRLLGRMRAEIAARLQDEHAEAALAWLESDIGQRVTRMEEEASTPQANVALQSYAAGLPNAPPSAARVELIQRLNGAAGTSELIYQLIVGTALGSAAAANALLPPEQRVSPEKLYERLQGQMSQVRNSAESMSLVSNLFTYRDLDDAALTEYVEFAESSSGRAYHDAFGKAFVAALIEAGSEVGRGIAEAILNKPAPGQRAL